MIRLHDPAPFEDDDPVGLGPRGRLARRAATVAPPERSAAQSSISVVASSAEDTWRPVDYLHPTPWAHVSVLTVDGDPAPVVAGEWVDPESARDTLSDGTGGPSSTVSVRAEG